MDAGQANARDPHQWGSCSEPPPEGADLREGLCSPLKAELLTETLKVLV